MDCTEVVRIRGDGFVCSTDSFGNVQCDNTRMNYRELTGDNDLLGIQFRSTDSWFCSSWEMEALNTLSTIIGHSFAVLIFVITLWIVISMFRRR